jgi:hypothetical protein
MSGDHTANRTSTRGGEDTATTDWMRNVQQECMALIDRLSAGFEGWTPSDQGKLDRFFIVEAGVWQNLCYEDI